MAVSYDRDPELDELLLKLAQEGRLADMIADLLLIAETPNIEINGVSVVARAPNPPISDKSCYKACLKGEIKKPGSYGECIKKCRKTKPAISISSDFVLALP